MSLSGTTRGSVRWSSSFKSSTGTSQVFALKSMLRRLAALAAPQRDAVARMKVRRRAIGSWRCSRADRSSSRARASKGAPASACASVVDRGDQPKARSLARPVGRTQVDALRLEDGGAEREHGLGRGVDAHRSSGPQGVEDLDHVRRRDRGQGLVADRA